MTNDDLGPHLDLFVRDLVTRNTVLVSVSTNGFGGGNDNVGIYSISSNGQVVAFDTAASNLAVRDNNRVSDIYVHDLQFGSRWRVSVGVNEDGDGNANGPSYNPLISEDGRYVVFESLASNLVTNDFNGTNDIFIHDLTTGITELGSVNVDGTASPDGPSHSPSISTDGLTVAFVSHATNLVIGRTNRMGDVYVRSVPSMSNTWAATNPQASSPVAASNPELSADGRFVAFKAGRTLTHLDLFRPTNLVFRFYGRSLFQFSDNPRLRYFPELRLEDSLSMSKDGGHATVISGTNVGRTIFRVDFNVLVTNVTWEGELGWFFTNVNPQAVIVSTNLVISHVGNQRRQSDFAVSPTLSDDGKRISFLSGTQIDPPSGKLIGPLGAYVRDATNSVAHLLTTNLSSSTGPDLSPSVPSISPDGTLIAWDSPDDNIVADDLNRAWDVFVRNVDTGETQLVSARHPNLPAASGTALSRLDLNPGALSANGQRLAILSLDNTLAPNDTNNWRDLFVRDLVTGTNFDVSRSIGRVPFSSQTNFPGTNTAAAPSLSADGRFVAFAGDALFFAGSTNRTIYWRDLQAPSNRVVVAGSPNNPAGVSYPVLGSNGRLVAFHSADIHASYYSDGNDQSDVFVRLLTPDPPGQDCSSLPFLFAPLFISVAAGTTTTANGASINPAFSPDSAWVLFQSRATNLLSDPIPAQSTYQLYARGVGITSFVTNTCGPIDVLAYTPTKLISYTTSASPAPAGKSTEVPLPGGGANPRFSADARYVAFESGTNLIYRHDLLGGWVTNITPHPEGSLTFYFTNLARITNDFVCAGCGNPTLNADGRFVAYETRRAVNETNDVFVKDLQSGQEELVSVNITGSAGGNGSSVTPLLSHDARFVVFASKASDLVPGDRNRATDIFVRDRLNGVTHCLSRNVAGTGTGNRVSSNPILSADGRTVAFQSFASDLIPGDYNDTRDVFVVTLAGPDADGDGLDDDWEMAYFSTASRDGSDDFDNDGASDLAEFRAGTNPANDASILRVLAVSTVHDSPYALRQATLVWSAVPGRTYRVQFKDNVTATTWMDVPGDVVAATTSASKTYTPGYYTGYFTNHRFYRVLLVQ